MRSITLKQPAASVLVVGLLLALVPCRTILAAVLYQQNFDGYTAGVTIVGQDGWLGSGAGPSLINTATQLTGNSLLGPQNSGSNTINVFGRAISGGLTAGETYTFGFDAFARSTSQVTHSSGLGLGSSSSVSSLSFAGSAYWLPLELASNLFAWRFDARELTGDSGAFFDIVGGFDAIQHLQIIVDTAAGELYGQYDFGGGLQQTTHYGFSGAQLAGLDAIFGYSDYRGQNGGASTPFGSQFSNAEYDNLLLTSSAEAVPGSAPAMVFISGLLALAGRWVTRARADGRFTT